MSRYAEEITGLGSEFFLAVNTVVDLAVLSASKCSRMDGPLRRGTLDGAMLAAPISCAGTEDDAPIRADKNTIENGALHMNFPLLEQAEVCLPSLQSAIVRMAHELFEGYESYVS